MARDSKGDNPPPDKSPRSEGSPQEISGDDLFIEEMAEVDLTEVLEIEREAFTVEKGETPWSRNSFIGELKNGVSRCYVLRRRGEGGGPEGTAEGIPEYRPKAAVAGYIIFWNIAGEGHILNIAVRSDLRGSGLGRSLMNFVIGKMKEERVCEAFLEVRRSNSEAIALYNSLGFKLILVRKRYYGVEDGLVMKLVL